MHRKSNKLEKIKKNLDKTLKCIDSIVYGVMYLLRHDYTWYARSSGNDPKTEDGGTGIHVTLVCRYHSVEYSVDDSLMTIVWGPEKFSTVGGTTIFKGAGGGIDILNHVSESTIEGPRVG